MTVHAPILDPYREGDIGLVAPAEATKMPSFSRLSAIASLCISLLLLGAVAYQMRGLAFGAIWAMVPVSPAFWAAFLAYYLAGPVSEWIIYRKLWHIPASGLAPLLSKFVSNELLLGYLGEVQFYAWARNRTNMTTAPFGAIKDITILSALVGNAVTVVLVAVVWPLMATTQIGLEMRTAYMSLSLVAGSSLIILFFRRRLFSLPAAELRFVALVHLIRTGIILGLLALMWHLVLPAVALSPWLILATLRMLISRLPLIPNKDVVFAGLAVVLLGQDVQIAALMTMIAGLLLVTHIIVGGALGALHVLQWRKQ